MSSRILPLIAVTMVLAISAPTHADPIPINVALGASVSASGGNASGTLPGNLVDGNYSTFHQFYGGNDGRGWWLLDLGESHTINGTYHRALPTGVTNYTIRDYSILGKLNEADDFTLLAGVTGNTSVGDDVDFQAFTARYVKFDILYCNYYGPAVWEFELYEVPEPTTMSVLALGGLAILRRGRKRTDS